MANRAVMLLLVLSTCLAALPGVPDWKALYDGHRWFELRDATDRTTPALYRGAVACAFNDVNGCEKTSRSIIRSKPRSEEAAEARGLLISLHHRAGHFGQALAEITAAGRKHVESEEVGARASPVAISTFSRSSTSPQAHPHAVPRVARGALDGLSLRLSTN